MKKRILLFALCVGLAFTGCNGRSSNSSQSNGGKFDPADLPFYEEDIDSLTYSYTAEERIRPYWLGNVIYNEQLMIVSEKGRVSGRLLYTPEKIISVRSWDLKTVYEEGKDYILNGDTLTLPEGSSIPVFDDDWSYGRNVPSEYPLGDAATGYVVLPVDIMYTETGLIYKNYIHVTYAYDPEEVDRSHLAKFEDGLYGLGRKIKAGEDINMVVFGDSISEGHSSSGLWRHEPFCPPYAELVRDGIEMFGNVNVNYNNISVGGKDSKWAAEDEQTSQLMALNPDLLIIAFGTNDEFSALEGTSYRRNIEKIIKAAKTVNSECQIILVDPFPSNTRNREPYVQDLIGEKLREITQNTEYLDVICVSMLEGCRDMLEKKHYYEISGNNVNHPNDFVHRFYAMNILSAIFDFENLK